MDYSTTKNGDVLEISVNGRLTFDEHSTFRRILGEVETHTGSRSVLDLNRIEFIDSAGLGLVLRLKDCCEKDGGSLSLRVPAEGQVAKMLSVTQFDQLVPYA